MKKTLYLLPILLFLSCSGDKIKLEGEFVKVLTKNKEFNVYTFDFNNTLNISDNGENYLITDKKGNKSIATLEKGVISYNNCKILVDKKENILISTCTNNNKSYSNDYWSKEKIDKYLSNIKLIKYEGYINQYLAEVSEGYDAVPTISDLNDKDKTYLDKLTVENNPFYPFISFGDFNNDNKYPDIVVIGTNQEGSDLYDKYYTTLSFLHADSERLKPFKFKEFYPFIRESSNMKISKNKTVMILNIKGWSGWNIKWNGRKYKTKYINLH